MVRLTRMTGKAKRLLQDYYPMVEQVQDAAKSIRDLRLSRSDITKGSTQSFTNCPNARCVKRRLPGHGVLVSRSVAFVIEGTTATRYLISGNARKIIAKADLLKVGDIGKRFTLSAPDPYHTLGRQHHSGNTGKRAKKPADPVVNLPEAGEVSLAQGERQI